MGGRVEAERQVRASLTVGGGLEVKLCLPQPLPGPTLGRGQVLLLEDSGQQEPCRNLSVQHLTPRAEGGGREGLSGTRAQEGFLIP